MKKLRLHFFTKIYILYTTVLIAVFILFGVMVYRMLGNELIEKNAHLNRLVVQNTMKYMLDKHQLVKKVTQQVYLDNLVSPEVLNFLLVDEISANVEYITMYRKFSQYIRSVFSRSSAIVGIHVYKQKNNIFYNYSRRLDNTEHEHNSIWRDRLLQMDSPTSTIKVQSSKDGSRYSLSQNIKANMSVRNIGLLIIEFSSLDITNELSQYELDPESRMVIVYEDSGVIYDSDDILTGHPCPVELLTNNDTAFIDGSMHRVIRIQNQVNKLSILCITSNTAILSALDGLKSTVFWLSLFCLLLACITVYALTRSFSHRIHMITDTLEHLESGQKNLRIPVHSQQDEITMIAEQINSMYDHLEESVKTIYKAQLQKKTAELAAYQTQMNPHFLYNTLGVIQLGARKEGAYVTAQMIYELTRLFQSMVREGEIISIEQELENCRRFITLCEYKFSNRFKVVWDIDNSLSKCGIIKHTLQPLIENYILHGFDVTRTNNLLTIIVRKENDDILIIVSDNGMGMRVDQLEQVRSDIRDGNAHYERGIGLTNIQERITLLWSKKYGINININDSNGLEVKILIPTYELEEWQNALQGISG